MTLHYQGNPSFFFRGAGGRQKMKQDMGISLCDKHMHKKRLSLVVVAFAFALPFLSRKKVVLQKSQGDLHAKCNLFTGWHNGFMYFYVYFFLNAECIR